MHLIKYITLSFWILSIFSTRSVLWAEEEERITLEDLDRIVSQAKDIKEFLESKKIQDEYYEGLKNYFGEDRFPRESYDAIVEQLKSTQEKFPEIAERVWDTSSMGKTFQINLTLKSSGLKLKKEAFARWLEAWKKKLSDVAASDVPLDLNNSAEAIATEIAAHYSEVASLPKAMRMQRSGEFIDSILKRPDFVRVASAALLERVSQESTNDLLGAGDADLVLMTMDSIKKSTDFTVSGRLVPKELQSLIGRFVPSMTVPKLEIVEGKPAETDLFVTETMQTRRRRVIPVGKGSVVTFELRTPIRRIHGLWKGIPINECVAGSCASKDSITPERWATILLEGAQFYHIERLTRVGRSYEGFVQLIPGIIGNKTYGSVDFGAPLFGKKIVARDGRIGIFYDLWLEEFTKQIPPEWSGIVVSESNAVNNSGVLPRIRNRPSYLFGPFANDVDRFVLQDDLAKRLSSLGIRKGLASRYAGRMIFDAVVPDAGRLVVLNSKATELPDVFTFTQAEEIMNQNRDTVKGPIFASILPGKIKSLSLHERHKLFDLASQRPDEKSHGNPDLDFALGVYSSPAIEELTEREANLLNRWGWAGKTIILFKSKNLPQALYVKLEEWSGNLSIKVEDIMPEIKKFPNFENSLKLGLKDPHVMIPAARALQLLGKQNAETDDAMILAMHRKENNSPGEVSLLEYYLRSTKVLSPKLLDELVETGLSSVYCPVVDAARVAISNHGKPNKELGSRLVKKIDEVTRFRDQVRIAGIFFDHGDVPPRAQIVYLATIGDDDWDGKDFARSLYSIPSIHPDALQWLATKIEKYDSDRTWEVIKFVRDAKNISTSALSTALTPLLTQRSEGMRLAAARMLVSKGVTSPTIEEILISSRPSSHNRTQRCVNASFQVSKAGREKLLEMLEAAESDLPQVILPFQKNLSPAHIARLRELQNVGRLTTRYNAAVILFEQGLGDATTLYHLVELSDYYNWSQEIVIERVRRALKILPITDSVIVAMSPYLRYLPTDVADLINRIPKREIRIKDALQADLDLYLQRTYSGDGPSNEQEAQSYVRLIMNPNFPNTDHAYRSLGGYDGNLNAREILEAGITQPSNRVKFYASLLLASREGLWDLEIQRSLVRWYMHADIPTDKSWSHLALEPLLGEVRAVNNEHTEQARKLFKIFSNANLEGEVLTRLLDYAKTGTEKNQEFVSSILLKNKSAHRDLRTLKLLNLEKAPKEPGTVADWINELQTGTAINDARKFLFGAELTANDQDALKGLLSHKESERRVTAANLLEHLGLWNMAIESVFIEVCTDEKVRRRGWAKEYFRDKLSSHGLSQTGLTHLISQLSNPNTQFEIVKLLSAIELNEDSIRKIRAAQASPEWDKRVLSAAILAERKIPDHEAKKILSSDGVDNRIDAKWLTETLGRFDLGADEVESIKQKLFHPDEKEGKLARKVFFGIEKPNVHFLNAYEDLLTSEDEWVRANAGVKLAGHRFTSKVEIALIDAMFSQHWNKQYIFEKLESNTKLSEAAQIKLAQDLMADLPTSETHSVRLLRNQIALFPAAEAILRTGTSNHLVREILASKKTRHFGENVDCAEVLKSAAAAKT
jgi:hypothetical protein